MSIMEQAAKAIKTIATWSKAKQKYAGVLPEAPLIVPMPPVKPTMGPRPLLEGEAAGRILSGLN